LLYYIFSHSGDVRMCHTKRCDWRTCWCYCCVDYHHCCPTVHHKVR